MSCIPKNRKHFAVLATSAVILLGSTGCSAINAQATTKEYAASDGIGSDIGPVKLRNFMILSNGEDEPGRLVGTAVNDSDSPVRLTVEGAEGEAQVMVPANGEVRFEEQDDAAAQLQRTGAMPGSLSEVTVLVNTEEATVQVPVLDGALPEYRELIPGGYQTPEAPESAAAEDGHSEAAPEGEEAGAGEAAPAESDTGEAADAGH